MKDVEPSEGQEGMFTMHSTGQPSQNLVLRDVVEDFDDQLLSKLYQDVLFPSFSADELESLEDMRRQIQNRTGVQLFAALDATDAPLAAFTAYWYPRSQVLLLGYLAVRSDRRGQGIGTWLTGHVRRILLERLQPLLALAEVEDPHYYAASHQFGDPLARIRLYERLGGRLLSMPYFQPRLRPESERVRNLVLMAFEISPSVLQSIPVGECVTTGVLSEFLEEYFTAAEGPETTSQDEEYLSLRNMISRMPCVPLHRPDDSLR
jgi:GNAT superfamily N-acetyltransferase